MIRPLALVAALVVACGHTAPPTRPEPVYDVGVGVLSRDRQSASNYAGYLVRVHLDPGRYTAEPGEVRVWGTVPGTPPLLTFRCPGGVPEARNGLVIVGRCHTPDYDGIWRTAHANYRVLVSDCSATPRP